MTIATASRNLSEFGRRMRWLIEGMLPEGHRGMIASCEGGCKTTLLCWMALCVALGRDVFGMKVEQRPVLMIDEETPTQSLERKLHRFCLGMELSGLDDVPALAYRSMAGFRFDRTNREISELIEEIEPGLVTIDTLVACLPAGRQGRGENNAETGIAIRDDLNRILKSSCGSAILMAVHSGKPVMYYDVEDYRAAPMQDLVRGHGSITGEACDTGYGLMKISERPHPLRFAIVPKPRRDAILMDELYVEMKEEAYGEGWARLERIDPVPTPPSRVAADLFSIFLSIDGDAELEASGIRSKVAGIYTPGETRLGLRQLLRSGVIIPTQDRFTFKLTSDSEGQADGEYIDQLFHMQDTP